MKNDIFIRRIFATFDVLVRDPANVAFQKQWHPEQANRATALSAWGEDDFAPFVLVLKYLYDKDKAENKDWNTGLWMGLFIPYLVEMKTKNHLRLQPYQGWYKLVVGENPCDQEELKWFKIFLMDNQKDFEAVSVFNAALKHARSICEQFGVTQEPAEFSA